MTRSHVDPSLVLAWQTAHSIARGSPAPVHDRGGFRVDSHTEAEVKRWVFPRPGDGLREIGHEIDAPRHYLKLCGSNEALRRALPSRWDVQPSSFFMIATMTSPDARPLPAGYRMELERTGSVIRASVLAPDGQLAASGCAAEAAEVFIYDRIVTAPDHRRKGLGLAVMTALASGRRAVTGAQLLVATEDGRRLYGTLGWTVLAPFATAVIPER